MVFIENKYFKFLDGIINHLDTEIPFLVSYLVTINRLSCSLPSHSYHHPDHCHWWMWVDVMVSRLKSFSVHKVIFILLNLVYHYLVSFKYNRFESTRKYSRKPSLFILGNRPAEKGGTYLMSLSLIRAYRHFALLLLIFREEPFL